MRSKSQPLFAVAVTLGLFGTAGLVRAQTPAPTTTRSYVQVVRLKPDMGGEWMALQKDEVIPAQ